MSIFRPLACAAALAALAACDVNENAADQNGAQQTNAAADAQSDADVWHDPEAIQRARQLAAGHGSEQQRQQMRQQAMQEMQGIRLVVDQATRKVQVYRGNELLREHDVAVGTEENPTPVGEFAFNRVDLNPRWVPPDSDWAEDREPKAPGDPENPMGRARLVYKMPYTIHGTDNLDSLGKAVSHGSIRLANENVIPLAETLLKAGGSWEGEEWFRQMVENRDEEFQIPLEQNVPLIIRPKEGQGSGQENGEGQEKANSKQGE